MKVVSTKQGDFMLMWVILFLVISIIAGTLGFFAISGVAAQIAKVLFLIFIVLFVISLIYSLFYHMPVVTPPPALQ